jgi:hypothetical protein
MRGWSNIQAIGERDSIAVVSQGSDLWHHPTITSITTPPSGGEQMEIYSTDDEDNIIGTGIRQIYLHYLDSAGDAAYEILDMDGTTPVATSADDIRFIQDIHSISNGDNGVAVGNIFIRSIANPTTNIYDFIELGGNMSLTIQKMVPANKTLYITHWHGSASGKNSVAMRLRSTDHHGELFENTFIFKDTVALENSSFSRTWSKEEWVPIPEFSIVKISVWTSGAGANVAGGWNGVLIDKTST